MIFAVCVAAILAQSLPGEPERLPGEPPRSQEGTFQGDSPRELRRGLRPHAQVALGLNALRDPTDTATLIYGMNVSATGGVTYAFQPSWGLVAQLTGQAVLGGRGGLGTAVGVGAVFAQYDVQARVTVGPAFLLNAASPLGLGVMVDLLRSLYGRVTIGAAFGYLLYRGTCDACVGGGVVLQEMRLGLSIGYGH